MGLSNEILDLEGHSLVRSPS